PACELVVMIGGVGEEIGRLPVRPHDDTVLLIAEGGRAKPKSAVPLLGQSQLHEPRARLLDRAAAVQLALPKPPIDARAEAREVALLSVEHPVDAPCGEPQALLALRKLAPLPPLRFRDRVRDLDHVRTGVALVGNRRGLEPDPLRESGPDRGAEELRLQPPIVRVELTARLESCGVQDP